MLCFPLKLRHNKESFSDSVVGSLTHTRPGMTPCEWVGRLCRTFYGIYSHFVWYAYINIVVCDQSCRFHTWSRIGFETKWLSVWLIIYHINEPVEYPLGTVNRLIVFSIKLQNICPHIRLLTYFANVHDVEGQVWRWLWSKQGGGKLGGRKAQFGDRKQYRYVL